ncbi:U3 small nucleolar ribonucleoprotein IMP3 [Trifolium repens]|nr:U3 small nucleolar ribonucleoprotein IMP3 [Trifolium repens]
MAERRESQREHDYTTIPSYRRYSSMCRMVQKLVSTVKQMDPKDPFRVDMTDKLLEKLYNMGVIPTRQSITLCERLTVSSFCRVKNVTVNCQVNQVDALTLHCPNLLQIMFTVLVKMKFAEHLKEAVTYIEQGHVRVGPDTITDPAFLVTRNMEDFITWVDSSKFQDTEKGSSVQ